VLGGLDTKKHSGRGASVTHNKKRMLHIWSFGDKTHRGKGVGGTCNIKKMLHVWSSGHKKQRGRGARGARCNKTK
jgi:hypothetical protein